MPQCIDCPVPVECTERLQWRSLTAHIFLTNADHMISHISMLWEPSFSAEPSHPVPSGPLWSIISVPETVRVDAVEPAPLIQTMYHAHRRSARIHWAMPRTVPAAQGFAVQKTSRITTSNINSAAATQWPALWCRISRWRRGSITRPRWQRTRLGWRP